MSPPVVDLVAVLAGVVLVAFALLARLRCRRDDQRNDTLWQHAIAEDAGEPQTSAVSGRP